MLYGYAYATDAQEAQRQRTALVKAGCERVYADVYEDDDPHRQMEALLDALRPGDEVVIGSKEQFAARRLHGRMLGLALRARRLADNVTMRFLDDDADPLLVG